MINITHHGATAGVTGSCHELTLHSEPNSPAGILIDCGLFQGEEKGDGANASSLSVDFPIEHIRARVHQVGGYSAHAGQSDLVRFIEGIPKKPAEIRIVHGDDSAKLAFRKCLVGLSYPKVLIPV